MNSLFLISALLFSLATTTSCSSGSSGGGTNAAQINAQRYFQTVSNIEIEVHYEPGAEPYDGNTGTGRPVWGLLGSNLTAIFQYRTNPPSLNYPTALNQMSAVAVQNKTSWTRDDILNLHARSALLTATETKPVFYVYFLKGNFNDGTGPNNAVLGVSLGGTTVIAMFKDVIESSATLLMVRKFVEQSTLIHEMGHSLGFVNNGVPLTSAHQDTPHGAHTTNQDCVMYWANEGASGLANFVQRYLSSGSPVMWGPEVLADAKAISK